MENEVVTRAPGKIIISGEHAVVYGKEALACSVDLFTECSAKHHSCPMLVLKVSSLELDHSFNLTQFTNITDVKAIDHNNPESLKFDEDNDMLTEWTGMKKTGLHIILYLFAGIALKRFLESNSGLTLSISTKLPVGGGLGSSASFAVALSSCLLTYCQYINKGDWNERELDLINRWAFVSEKIVHGTPSGVDNSISTYGHCITFKAGRITKLQSSFDWKVLVVNTKVKRSTKYLVAKVRERKEQLPDVYGSLFDCMENITKEFIAMVNANLNDSNAVSKIQHLFVLNQHLLDAIGVGHSTINEINDTCRQSGVHCKITGAGGGGCVFGLLTPSVGEATVQELINTLSPRFECWVCCLGGDGVKYIA